MDAPFETVPGRLRWTALAVLLQLLVAGCLQAVDEAQPSTEDFLAPGVDRFIETSGEIAFSRDDERVTVHIDPDPFTVAGELRQYAIRASTDLELTIRNSAITDNWGFEGGCQLISAHYPAPFVESLVYSRPVPAYQGEAPNFAMLSVSWGGGGYVSARLTVDEAVIVDDGAQAVRPAIVPEYSNLGHEGDDRSTVHMDTGSWILFLAGGFAEDKPGQMEWDIEASATGGFEVYRLPSTPLQCNRAGHEAGSTEASFANYRIAQDVAVAMSTNNASTLFVEHENRDVITDPTSAAIHHGSYRFLGTKGEIVKNSFSGTRTFAHCYASSPGDIGFRFDEITGSSTVHWLLADTAYLPFTPEPVCGDK